MSTTLVTVEPDATVAEAAQLMSIHHVGAALVLAGGTLHGIFTERDIVRALAAEHDAAGHTVTGWMSHDPVTLPPEAMRLRVSCRASNTAPDEYGRLAGSFSSS